MKPGPAKAQALQDCPTPEYQKQLKSFLGLTNYPQPLLPDLASKTTFLWEQVSHWDWNPSTDAAFHQLKQKICNTLLKTTFPYFNHTKPILKQTFASEYGLGVALIQDGRPITFLSKTLTNIKTRYTNIEYGCLSVCFGLEKFHTYIYDRHIILNNDHKLPEMIHKKPIQAAAPIYKECYYTYRNMITQFKICHVKDIVLADHLMQFPSQRETCQFNYTRTYMTYTSHQTNWT